MAVDFVRLKRGYDLYAQEYEEAALRSMRSGWYILGKELEEFEAGFAEYMGAKYCIGVNSGLDALILAVRALDIGPGDEVIVPANTYIASVLGITENGATPVFVEPDRYFCIDAEQIEQAVTDKTKAILPVHLYGQPCEMDTIQTIAEKYGLYVIEDNAQAIGARYTFPDGTVKSTGTIGDIGCTSFFPSKNLGCYGDGGAIFTDDDTLGEHLRMTANHGQRIKYHHEVIGCNSRLDTIQAVVLNAKLPHLDEYCTARYKAAQYYTEALKDIVGIITPTEHPNSTHVYHQYTLKVLDGRRDDLKQYLSGQGIPSMIYYPLPLQQQEAFLGITRAAEKLDTAAELAASVLSLPIHTEITREQQDIVIDSIRNFFKQ